MNSGRSVALLAPRTVVRDTTTIWPSHPARPGNPLMATQTYADCLRKDNHSEKMGILASRKPTLSLRLVGLLSLRLAERILVVSLFHEPPRKDKRIGGFPFRVAIMP